MLFENLQNGRYQTVRELGSGSMGEVFLVNDTVIGRQVAVKVMRADPAAYPDTEAIKDAVRLFKREAQAIARLEHAKILPLFDFGEEKREKTVFTYMVMPYCQEGALSDWLKRHRPNQQMPLDEVAYFVEQAAEALQYAHEHGIIHQDVKPSNFLLRTHTSGQLLPDLLLADFGIAKMSSGATITTVTTLGAGPRGTPRYMPPEQWEGRPVAASDQYALAVMAYQLLTLRFPFMGEQMLHLMYQHLQNTPEPPGKWNHAIPPALDAVILRALAKKPAERFPSVTEFARALRQALQKVPPVRSGQAAGSSTFESMSAEEAAYRTHTPTLAANEYPMPAPQNARNNPHQPTLPPREQPAQAPLMLPANSAYATPATRTQFDPPVQPQLYLPARTMPPGQRPAVPSAYTPVPNPPSWAPTGPELAPTQAEPRPKAPARGKAALVISLLLLLVVLAGGGAASYFYFSRTNQPPPVDTHTNPYTNAMPNLLFTDPLSKSAMWQSLQYDQLTDGFCLFQQGAYHASSNKTHVYTLCPAASQQPSTTDMTFEMQMQILHGDCGGLLFRGDFTQGNFYYFDVCFDGQHYFATYKNFALLQAIQLPHQATVLPTLKADSQATITVGVVAQGSTLTFFLNGQQVDQITDTTYTGGQIALLCFAINHPTEIVFSKARLWTA